MAWHISSAAYSSYSRTTLPLNGTLYATLERLPKKLHPELESYFFRENQLDRLYGSGLYFHPAPRALWCLCSPVYVRHPIRVHNCIDQIAEILCKTLHLLQKLWPQPFLRQDFWVPDGNQSSDYARAPQVLCKKLSATCASLTAFSESCFYSGNHTG